MAKHVDGADVVAKNILVFTKGFLREVNKGMERVRGILDGAVTRNISLTDHSLKQLAEMGHPYARRAPQRIHSPEYQVHSQSGRMLDAKVTGTEPADVSGGRLTASAYVGISGRARHAVHVIFGTSYMVPRDFLRGSLNEIRAQAIEILKGPLKNAVVSFDGEKVRL